MKRLFVRFGAVCLSVALLLTGCGGSSAESSSGAQSKETKEESQDSGEITVTDICGREVTVKKQVEKVILTFNFEEYFAVTGEEGVSKIVGWSRKYWEGRRQSTWDVFVKKFPELNDVPDVGYIQKNTFNVETAISLEPDVIFMAKNDFEIAQTDLERLDAAGIPVVFVDYHEQTMENHCNSTILFGKVMGQEEKAQEVIDFYKEQVSVVTDRLAKAGSDIKRPKVYVEFSEATGPETFGSTYGKKMWGAIVEQCGGDNIAKDLVEGASAPINPEQVLAANPDIIIFAGNQFENSDINIGLGYTSDKELAIKNMKTYANRPGWNELNAVKNGRMLSLYHDLSRHIFDFGGLQFFAKAIHPELFEDLDPNETLKEFHEKFYPVDYTGVWMIGMEE